MRGLLHAENRGLFVRNIQWTLTWEDLTRFENELSEAPLSSDELTKKINLHKSNYDKIGKAPTYKSFDAKFLECKNNMSRLLYVLENLNQPELLNGLLCKQLLFPLQLGFLSYTFAETEVQTLLIEPAVKFEGVTISKTPEAFAMSDNLPLTEGIDARLFFQINTLNVLSKISVSNQKSSWEKKSWENFWCLYNLWQFMGSNIQLPDAEAK